MTRPRSPRRAAAGGALVVALGIVVVALGVPAPGATSPSLPAAPPEAPTARPGADVPAVAALLAGILPAPPVTTAATTATPGATGRTPATTANLASPATGASTATTATPAATPATGTTPPTAATTAPVRLRSPVAPPVDPYAPEADVVLGTVDIPALGLAVPLHQGISLRSIDRGPSHWPGTALPGEHGNVVVAGHRVTHTRPFRHLDRLVVGDEVVFTVEGRRSVYRVTGHDVVTPDAMHIVDQTPEATATLFACHPPGSARYRYVVRLALDGVPVPAPPAAA